MTLERISGCLGKPETVITKRKIQSAPDVVKKLRIGTLADRMPQYSSSQTGRLWNYVGGAAQG